MAKVKVEYSEDVYDLVDQLMKKINPSKYIYFRKMVEKNTGKKILPASEKLMNHVNSLCESFVNQLNEDLSLKSHSGIGWDMESKFREYANFRSPIGRGYPDNESELDDQLFYIEGKTCNEENMEDTIRTFYYNCYDKIKQDAPHLLVSFEFKQTPKGKEWTGKYHVVDLYDKKMSLRMEINNNGFGNKDMYNQNIIHG